MATYTHQPNPQYFEVPAFDAPVEFLFQVARQKQGEFDQGLRAVQTEYKSMENLPVTSQFGVAKRDAYMQEASKKLRSIAGADFSLAENRHVANSIYKPLVTDKSIITDLQKGRQAQKEVQLMDRYKNSRDEKERALYWSVGEEYVNRSIRQLQNAKTAEELDKVDIKKFVPYSDIIGKLNKAATEQDLKISIDRVTDGYIVTDVNGRKAFPSFYIWAQSQLGPEDRAVLQVLGSVESDRRIEQEMSFGLTEDQARSKLATEAIQKRFDDFHDQIQQNLRSIKDKQTEIETYEKAGVTDANISRWMNAKDELAFMEQQNGKIDDRLRELGFNKISGEYVRDQSRYGDALKRFSKYLDVPYAEDAGRNILMNWAAGLASATAELQIKDDPHYSKQIDLMMKQMELEGKRIEALGKEGAKESTSKGKTEKEDFINEPTQVGYNPEAIKKETSYETFQNTKKAILNDLTGRGVGLIYEAIPEKNVHSDLLSAIAQGIRDGAENMDAILSKDSKYPGYYEAIKKMMNDGDIPKSDNPYDVFKGLLKYATEEGWKKIRAANDGRTTGHIAAISGETKKGIEIYQIFRDDTKRIEDKILVKEDYKDFRTKEGFINKEDWVRSRTGGYASVQDFMESKAGDPRGYPAGGGATTGPYFKDPVKESKRYISNVEKMYDEKRKKFDDEFAEFVNSGEAQFIKPFTSPSGKTGWTYPEVELNSRANPSSSERELSERVLTDALSFDDVGAARSVTNIKNLGSPKAVSEVARVLSNSLGDLTPDKGRVYYRQILSDGKSSGILFKPTRNFIKDFVSKNNFGDLSEDVIANMEEYGIEIAVNVPELQSYRPSIIGRLVDINGEYEILPELKSEGFYGKIKKRPDNQGYDVYVYYKYFDKEGNEKITTDDEAFQNPGVPIPQSRLDSLGEGTTFDILDYFYKFKDLKNKKTSVPGQKIYTKEELELKYKSRQ